MRSKRDDADVEELELIQKLAEEKGVEKHFEKLYECYSARLYGFACRMLRTRSMTPTVEGEDILQQAMLNAFQALQGFSRERILQLHLSAWLYKITLNAARRNIEQRSRVQVGGEEFENAIKELCDGTTPATIAERRDQLERILKAVETLPSPYAEVAVLYFIDDMKQEDIATKLGRTLPAVKTQVMRAKPLLRQALRQLIEEASHE
jgi:RNA polymerase sigma-70 factor (ECF subfamily)